MRSLANAALHPPEERLFLRLAFSRQISCFDQEREYDSLPPNRNRLEGMDRRVFDGNELSYSKPLTPRVYDVPPSFSRVGAASPLSGVMYKPRARRDKLCMAAKRCRSWMASCSFDGGIADSMCATGLLS